MDSKKLKAVTMLIDKAADIDDRREFNILEAMDYLNEGHVLGNKNYARVDKTFIFLREHAIYDDEFEETGYDLPYNGWFLYDEKRKDIDWNDKMRGIEDMEKDINDSGYSEKDYPEYDSGIY